jgi:hypothetical protein
VCCITKSAPIWHPAIVAAETRVSDWVAHNNAIFDVCWIKVTKLFAMSDLVDECNV